MWKKKLAPLDIEVLNNLLSRLDALEYPVLKLNLLVEALDSAVDFGASRGTLRVPCGALKSIFFFFFFFSVLTRVMKLARKGCTSCSLRIPRFKLDS